MTIPNFLSDAVNEPQDASHSIPDVETGGVGMITMARLMLVTNGNWTEPSTALFQSPNDAAGHWFDILMTRIDADTMEFRVRDKNGNTIQTGRVDINAAGNTTVEYYAGNFYFAVVSRRATAEWAWAFLLDPTTLADDASAAANRTVCFVVKNTSGTLLSGASKVGELFAWDNGAANQGNRFEARGTQSGSGTANNATCTDRTMQTASGRMQSNPMNIFINQGGTALMTGALPCVLLVDASFAFDAVRNGPLDGSTTRKFIVLPATTIHGCRMAIRKPSLDA